MNTSLQHPIDVIRALIEALPLATLVAKRDGSVLFANRHAQQALLPADPEAGLAAIFTDGERLATALRLASSSSGGTPAGVTARENGTSFRATLSPLILEPGTPSGLILVTLQDRSLANHRMVLLRDKLEDAADQRRALEEQNRSLQKTIAVKLPALREQSFRDSLTGLYNRRYFDSRLEREWHRAVRDQSQLSLLFCDIDRFKRFNDTFGHPQGDECLRLVGHALARTIEREFDFVARIGGEEFALVLPMTDAAGAERVARRLLASLREQGIERTDTDAGAVTMSCGVATAFPHQDGEPELLVRAADEAMYKAKRRGRNCYVVASEPRLVAVPPASVAS